MNVIDVGKRRPLSSGSYGTIYLARHEGRDVAIKQSHSDEDAIGFPTLNELSILHLLGRHPHIVKVTGFFDDGRGHFALGFGRETHDARHLAGQRADIVKQFILQSLSAVIYCHQRDVLHLDLKPSNFIYSYLDEDTINVRLIDFGLSAHASDRIESRCQLITAWYRPPEAGGSGDREERREQSRSDDLSRRGTPRPSTAQGVALEQLARAKKGTSQDLPTAKASRLYTRKSDYYSLAATILHLMTGESFMNNVPDDRRWRDHLYQRYPIDIQEHVAYKEKAIALFERTPGCYLEVLDLLAGMMAFDVEDRYDIDKVMTHPFLAPYISDLLLISKKATEINAPLIWCYDVDEVPVKGIPAHVKRLAGSILARYRAVRKKELVVEVAVYMACKFYYLSSPLPSLSYILSATRDTQTYLRIERDVLNALGYILHL
jgi:serine/threonine protein kinase